MRAKSAAAAAAAAALLLLAVIAMSMNESGQQDLSEVSTNSVQHSSVQHLTAKFKAAHAKAQASVKDLAATLKARATAGHKSPLSSLSPGMLPHVSGLADVENKTSDEGSACPTPELADSVSMKARTWGWSFTADVINHLPNHKEKQVGFISAVIGNWDQEMIFFDDSGGVAGELDAGDKVVAKATRPFFSWDVDTTTIEECTGKVLVQFSQNQARRKTHPVSRYEIDDDDDNELVIGSLSAPQPASRTMHTIRARGCCLLALFQSHVMTLFRG